MPPRFYGGAERVVDMLANGLATRGHHVTLFAHRDSTVQCRLIPYPGKSSASIADSLRNMNLISRTILRGRFDLVHSFGRMAYLIPLLPLPIVKIMSYGRWISTRSVAWGHALSRGTLHFTACSQGMTEKGRKYGDWHVIYHGVPLNIFRFEAIVPPDAPLIYLGRIEHGKGVHLAIQVAKQSGRKLVIAGNVASEHQTYFKNDIQPCIDNGQIQYVGPVDDAQKSEWLRKSSALLFPVLWEEPFGIVMAEALACGTPVIGFRRGSVSEIVQNGYNGFLCDSVEDMVESIGKIDNINRVNCRQTVESKFAEDVIVDEYERMYFSLLKKASSTD